ncbi:MAG TPA: aa3-type cytochrome c oxidase subunit IV [Beijerinckia sp.]|jgi:hypothetical protein|nr:aa3-type cytochrome c oxidase subunit IV [Beijerinckia sp.]
MAEEHVYAGHPAMDYAEHEKTYRMFIGMVKYGSVAAVLALILLAYLTL